MMSKVNLPDRSDAESESEADVESSPEVELDPVFQQQIDNLYRVNVYTRWIVIFLLWLTVGAYSLWELRYPIGLIREDFTWAAVKYGLIFNLVPAVGLCLCVGVMTGTLVWQSRNILWGLPKPERKRLIQHVCQIRKQGKSHPFWKWVVGEVRD